MRIAFRKSWISQTQRDRALFFAPIVVALILLFLFAQNKAVFASAWRSPLSVLSDRSPGSRAPGALYNIKPVQLIKAEPFKPVLGVPQERVLAVTRERVPPFADFMPAEATPLNLITDGEPIVEGFTPLVLDLPSIPFAPPIQTRLPPGCCAPNLAPPAPPSPAPVPEPTTWMLNILGLFLIGGLMRRRNRRNGAVNPGSALPLRG